MYRDKAGMRKPQEPYLTTEWWRPPHWPPMQCTCIPSSLCYLQNKVNYMQICKCIVLEARKGAGNIPWWGRVLEVFSSHLISVLFSAPSLLEMKFFRNYFPNFLLFFGGVLNRLSNTTRFTSEYDITLQTNALIANDEIYILFAAHLQVRYHTADECVHR